MNRFLSYWCCFGLVLVLAFGCKKEETPTSETFLEETCDTGRGFEFDTLGHLSNALIINGRLQLSAHQDFFGGFPQVPQQAKAIYDFSHLELENITANNLCLKIDFTIFEHTSTNAPNGTESNFLFQFGKNIYSINPEELLFLRGESLYLCFDKDTFDYSVSLESEEETIDITEKFILSRGATNKYQLEFSTGLQSGFFSTMSLIELDYFKLYSFE